MTAVINEGENPAAGKETGEIQQRQKEKERR